VKHEFKKAKLDIPNQSFIISQYEQSTNESKVYRKVKTNPNVFDALRNMKTDEIFYRNCHLRRPSFSDLSSSTPFLVAFSTVSGSTQN
jgi:hypothetical protein